MPPPPPPSYPEWRYPSLGSIRPKTPFTYASFDQPLHSRLFVVLARYMELTQILSRFAHFGDIEDYWMPEGKPVVFLKFARSSQACRAVEETQRWLPCDFAKVCLAHSRAFGKLGEPNFKLLAEIYVKVPTSFTKMNLKKTFKVYGHIASCTIIRNKVVGDSKYLAWIKFTKASQAALAIEECDKSYQAIWAYVRTDFPEFFEHEFCVNGSKQETVDHEVQGATLNTLCKHACSVEPVLKLPAPPEIPASDKCTSLDEPMTKNPATPEIPASDKRTSLDEPMTKTPAPPEIPASDKHTSLDEPMTKNPAPPETPASDKRTSLDEPMTKTPAPPEIPASDKHTSLDEPMTKNPAPPETPALDKHTSLGEPVAKPTEPSEPRSLVVSAKKETASCGVQGSSLIPVVSRTTSTEPVSGTKQKRNFHRVEGSNLLILGPTASKTKTVPVHKARSYTNGTETNPNRVRESNLITLASADNTTSTEPAAKSSESSVKHTEQKRNHKNIKTSNLITFSYNTSEVGPVSKPPEHYGYEYCLGSTGYNSTLPATLTGLPGSSLYYSHASSVEQQTKDHRIQESNLIAPGYNTSEVGPVSKPPEHCGYEYCLGSTGYNSTLPASLTGLPGSSLYYSHASSVEQQTKDHRIQESNLIAPVYNTILFESNVPHDMSNAKPEASIDEIQHNTVLTSGKSLKSSEHKFYMGGARQKAGRRKVQGSHLLASVDPPDLASVERSNARRQESISRRLLVASEFPLAKEQISSLFDVIPGLESCETRPGRYSNRVYAMIQYRNVASAVYAKCRLHGLEYPAGNRLHVSFVEGGTHGIDFIQEMATELVTSQLASVIWDKRWAPLLPGSSESWIPSHFQADAELPSRKRKAPPDSSVCKRLFIMFDPHPLPQDILDSVLSRFGNFRKSHFIPGENVAYAMFAETASASNAIAVLHGKTVNGVKLKVVLV